MWEAQIVVAQSIPIAKVVANWHPISAYVAYIAGCQQRAQGQNAARTQATGCCHGLTGQVCGSYCQQRPGGTYLGCETPQRYWYLQTVMLQINSFGCMRICLYA